MALLRKTTWIRIVVILGPFALIIGVAYLVAPVLRDRQLRSELARVGESFERTDVGGIQVYHGPAIDDETVRLFGVALEVFCDRLVSDWGRELGLRPVDKPLVLEIFDSTEQLEEFHRDKYREEFHNIGGFYDARKRLIAIPRAPYNQDLATLFHEGTHLVFDLSHSRSIGAFPLWVNEGLATYFEETRFTPEGEIRLGGPNANAFDLVAAALRSGRITSVEAVVDANPAKFREEDNAIFYAASHTLVAYLIEGEEGALRRGFGGYLRELRGGGRVTRGLIYFKLGKEPKEIDEGWRRFIDRSP